MSGTYWNDRWLDGRTQWDLGAASPPLLFLIDTIEDKNAAILIPGCGNAYEADALLAKGFSDITLIDIAEEPVKKLRHRYAHNPHIRILHEDFFHHKGQYDYILEQTFFCAIPPQLRTHYNQKVIELLKPGGYLLGVLFDHEFEEAGPPFGGHLSDYYELFGEGFSNLSIEACTCSIPPRAGKEVIILAQP